MKSTADYNLLFGILALQMDFVSREQLVAAMNAWVLEKNTSLGEILLRQKAFDKEERQLLEALVAKHLAKHGGDAEKSLAAVSSIDTARDELQRLADADVQASLVHVPRNRDVPDRAARDLGATLTQSMGESTSSGVRFRVLRPHARGGLGEVLVAEDGEFGREVALKQIQAHYADDPDSRGRFLLEAEITGGLEHPGIVPVYGLGTYANGRPFYAMRFIRGDSLKDAIENFHSAATAKLGPGERTLRLRKLLGRFVDVCNAVEYAHSRGVLHRDLKPGNIMLGKYGETLVVDWGLAKPMGQMSSTLIDPTERALHPSSASSTAPERMGSAIGTPQFMSPEQAAGQLDQLGPGSDVYSLGATLYCLLTGKAPMSDETTHDVGKILRRVQSGDFVPPRKLAPDIPEAARGDLPQGHGPQSGQSLSVAPRIGRRSGELACRRTRDRAARHVDGANVALGAAASGAGASNGGGDVDHRCRGDCCRGVDRTATPGGGEPCRRERCRANSGGNTVSVKRNKPSTTCSPVSAKTRCSINRERKSCARSCFRKHWSITSGSSKREPTIRRSRDELGVTYFRAGRIVKDLQSPQEALNYYADAQKIQERLLADAPANSNRMKELADTYNAIGEAQHRGQRLDDAQKAYQQALDLREQFARQKTLKTTLKKTLKTGVCWPTAT